jgi:hypothetical protein
VTWFEFATLIAEAAEEIGSGDGWDGPYVAYMPRPMLKDGIVIDRVISEAGEVRIHVDPGMPDDKILITTIGYFGSVGAIVVGPFDD